MGGRLFGSCFPYDQGPWIKARHHHQSPGINAPFSRADRKGCAGELRLAIGSQRRESFTHGTDRRRISHAFSLAERRAVCPPSSANVSTSITCTADQYCPINSRPGLLGVKRNLCRSRLQRVPPAHHAREEPAVLVSALLPLKAALRLTTAGRGGARFPHFRVLSTFRRTTQTLLVSAESLGIWPQLKGIRS